MPGYDSNIQLSGSSSSPRVPPRKPTMKSVALPETSSPVASRSAGVNDVPNRFPWFRSHPKLHRSTTPAPARTQLRDSHIHEPASHRMRTSSISSNSSDRPLKGILKNPSSRSTTPAPPPPATVPSKSGKVEPSHSKPKEKILSDGPAVSKALSSNSSKLDGYYSDASHAYSKKRLSQDNTAPSSTFDAGKMYSEKSAQYGKATPIKVPMKPEVISLNWPLLEYRNSRSRERRRVCFDIAFDPRLAKGVRVPESGHLIDMSYNDIRLPASNHCTLTEMRIAVVHNKMEYWPINVERKKGIRCLDVFEAIYKTYHMRLTKEELQTIGENTIRRCEPFFVQRCADSPGLTEYNIKEGMRRVDVLRGGRFFKGLTQQGSGWVLHLDEYHS